MATLYVNNDNSIELVGYFDVTDSSYVNDAIITATICDADTETVVTGATNASPIVITATGSNFTNGNYAAVAEVTGNRAANTVAVVASATANTFALTSTTGDGTYTDPASGSDTNRGRCWEVIGSAQAISMSYVSGTNGTYRGTAAGTLNIAPNSNVVVIVRPSNYDDEFIKTMKALRRTG